MFWTIFWEIDMRAYNWKKKNGEGADVPLPEETTKSSQPETTGNLPITSSCGCLMFQETERLSTL